MVDPPIPVNDLRRAIDEDRTAIEAAVASMLDSGWLVHGQQHAAFESEFASYIGAAHCVGIANGTEALAISLRALEVPRDSEVCIVGNAGFYAATACLEIGARPLYVDVDPDSLNMSARSLDEALARKPSAVIATHLYGGMCDIADIAASCARAGVPLVEDCAQATGAMWKDGRRAGAFGALGCFSFYPTKNLGAIGDGGAIVTSSDELAERCRRIRQYGWQQRYVVQSPGLNSRLDEIQAAILRHRLSRLDDRNARRRRIAARYARALSASSDSRLVFWDDPSHVAHLAVVLTPWRDELRTFLDARGISTDVHYPIPDLDQPVWDAIGVAPTTIARAATDVACEQVVSLPCFPELTEEETEAVAVGLEEFAVQQSPSAGAS